ncbi:MAG: SAM-dependent methyltransferase, partial [Bacteroidales bacterium]|nr:SAM-dependent methyltransferase [Bacteroidales bacterium]
NVGTDGQMKFIEHALNVVSPQNGIVIAIVQMSCAIKNEKELIAVKRRILEKHHLKAVLSMPDDLFYPVGVVTCIMVFEANKPNKGFETFFGYFKDDGFEKRKNQGRIDARNRYKEIKGKWLNAYNNKKEIPGLSVMQEVSADDEWCAEAYMETDYSKINQTDFEKKVRDYIAFKFLNNIEQ